VADQGRQRFPVEAPTAVPPGMWLPDMAVTAMESLRSVTTL
jgi:hypothetical protein